jgi:hypothetical protein
MRSIAIIVAALVLAACGSSTAPNVDSPVVGTWTGHTNVATLTLVLTENSGNVSGTATYTKAPAGPVVLDVRGTFANPSLKATMPSLALAATVSGTMMVGALTEPGKPGQYITLAKQ